MNKSNVSEIKKNKLPLNLCTVKEFCEAKPWANPATVRGWIFNAQKYKFESCVTRIGGKVFLNLPEIEAWIRTQNATYRRA